MKKLCIFVLGLFLVSWFVFSQDIIGNREKPENPLVGRSVELEEVLRITDEGGEFYFRYPFALRVAPDGAIFVQEQQQLLHFDKTGRFIRNYFKKGQGPGEVNYVTGFIPTGKQLIVFSTAPDKILWFDYNGQVIKEVTVRSPVRLIRLFHYEDGTYYFVGSDLPFQSLERFTPSEIVWPQMIFRLKEGHEQFEKLESYPIQAYIIPGKKSDGGIFSLSTFNIATLGDGTVVLSHTPEYLLKIYSLENNWILRTFRRKYSRVKPEPQKDQKGGLIIDGKHYTSAPQKYVADISSIYSDRSRIWVVTSTKNKDACPLIDVFDSEGRYLDNFFLKLPPGMTVGNLSANASVLRDGFLFLISRSEEDLVSIVKYKIRDPAEKTK
jgi:hypothetical protein